MTTLVPQVSKLAKMVPRCSKMENWFLWSLFYHIWQEVVPWVYFWKLRFQDPKISTNAKLVLVVKFQQPKGSLGIISNTQTKQSNSITLSSRSPTPRPILITPSPHHTPYQPTSFRILLPRFFIIHPNQTKRSNTTPSHQNHPSLPIPSSPAKPVVSPPLTHPLPLLSLQVDFPIAINAPPPMATSQTQLVPTISHQKEKSKARLQLTNPMVLIKWESFWGTSGALIIIYKKKKKTKRRVCRSSVL